jgi:hypothetical protein
LFIGLLARARHVFFLFVSIWGLLLPLLLPLLLAAAVDHHSVGKS